MQSSCIRSHFRATRKAYTFALMAAWSLDLRIQIHIAHALSGVKPEQAYACS